MVTADSAANSARSGITAGLMLSGAVCLLALPSAVLALATQFEPKPAAPVSGEAMGPMNAMPASMRLARAIPLRSLNKDQPYPFTPASTPNRSSRSITVAVRVDPLAAQTIYVRGRRAEPTSDASATQLGIAPTAFQLGVSRGYTNFSQALVTPDEVRKIDMPDLSTFKPGTGSKGASGPFSPRIVIDEKQAAGRAPRTFAGDAQDEVDVGGSYRLTRNLNVTAGVRYSQERDRLKPLTDGKQDSQAVYVGTHFRF